MDLTEHSFKILNAIANSILVIDRNYQIVGANDAACKSFCLSPDSIVGHKCFKITHKLDKQCWREGISCPVKTTFETKKRTRIIHKHIYDSETIFEEIIASPIFDDHGEVDFVVEELNDITELIQSREVGDYLKRNIKTLQELLPICANCKSIRDDKGYWSQIESYISSHSEVQFSHCLCEKCREELYGEEEWYMELEERRKNEDKNR